MLGAALAITHKLNTIKFYENGIVSINLPISEQLVGARASRSTHPKAIAGMGTFLSTLHGDTVKVTNPFMWKTKSEVVKVIKNSELSQLIRLARSCSHVRMTNTYTTHCGVCSQCIDRRIATLYNDIGNDDPEDMYEKQLFLDSLQSGNERTMVASYISHSMELAEIDETYFFERFPETSRVFPYLYMPTSDCAQALFKLHQRQRAQVVDVVNRQISKHNDLIRKKQVSLGSLLWMLIKQPELQKQKYNQPMRFPTPEGATWEDVIIEIISNDSVRISVKGITKRYHAIDLGFRDTRKGDLPNKQWDLLVQFAISRGEINWKSDSAQVGIQKRVQQLNKDLKQFFQIAGNPISRYRKDVGYVTKFRILDKKYGRC